MPTERNLFNADHGVGKGDKERSSGWRKNYDEIKWPGVTMQQQGSKQVKYYGMTPVPLTVPCIDCSNCGEGIALSPEEYQRQAADKEHGWLCPKCGAIAFNFYYRATD